ncbi:MAG: SIMPL domain-containing protein [Vampirovibrionales bacterium]|nr:SIMPL domain-containing protein [Vampirovibrionales bacterium]
MTSRNVLFNVAALSLSVIAAAGLMGAQIATWADSHEACCPPQDAYTINASGRAEVKAMPDAFSLSAQVETNEPTLEKARSQNTKNMQAVRASLKALGIANLKLQTVAFNIYPVYKTDKGERLPKLLGYHASNSFNITATGLSSETLAESASKVLAAASQSGATNVGGLRFYIENPEPLQLKALEQAAQNARAQAQALAAGSGAKLGDLITISSGYSAPVYSRAMPMAAMMKGAEMADAEAPPPVEVSESTLSSDVSARYALVKPAGN